MVAKSRKSEVVLFELHHLTVIMYHDPDSLNANDRWKIYAFNEAISDGLS